MRQVIIEEPYSKAALISRRLAVFSAAVAAAGALGLARGVDLLAVLGGAALAAILAALLALSALVIIWRTGRKGAGQALAGLLVPAVLLAYPGYLAFQAVRSPRLADLSTDLADPPGFSLSRAAYAARGGTLPPAVPAAKRKEQLAAFPQIQPLLVDLDGEDTFEAALAAMRANGWTIIEATPPGGRSGVGHIDAIASIPILGFASDVTARIRPLTSQTRIDIRSVSRFALYDFGAGAHNIANFEAALQQIVDRKQ
jgi:hypothetical protein